MPEDNLADLLEDCIMPDPEPEDPEDPEDEEE